MGLETTTVKNLLLILNFILMVLSCILIGFGIFIVVSGSQNLVDHGETVAGAMIITLGALILIVSIFGCLAAIHEAKKRLLIYVIAVGVLVILQLLMSATTSQGSKDGLSGSVEEGFQELWNMGKEKNVTGVLAYYEEWLKCCGVHGPSDYKEINQFIPKTCCIANICQVGNVYEEGCYEKFAEYLSGKMVTFNIVSWLLIILEITSASFAWMLQNALKNASRRANVSWM